jgi:hypothetical protein
MNTSTIEWTIREDDSKIILTLNNQSIHQIGFYI